jgi:cytosine/adenosine deaminase-related metal-dependent hydrolase
MRGASPFFEELSARIAALGGMDNAHLHLDRAGTLDATRKILSDRERGRESQLSLSAKHSLIPAIHASPCYDRPAMAIRANAFLDRMVESGTTRAATVVDTTCDRIGMSGLDLFRQLKRERAGTLDLDVGAYSPLGFRDDEPDRWDILEAGAEIADFIGLLPERDDRQRYPEHIGFEECCRRGLRLAAGLGKPIHIHVDQMNHPSENLSERMVEVFRRMVLPVNHGAEPWVWLVHVISPSTYEERRFNALVESLVELNFGVICCPSAALSMRQYRTTTTPTGNSIARVLEMLAAGVHVRVGSDNICDITSPAGTPDLLHEIYVLCNAVRYYDLDLLAKLAAGVRPDAADRMRLERHLLDDRAEIGRLSRAA